MELSTDGSFVRSKRMSIGVKVHGGADMIMFSRVIGEKELLRARVSSN